MKNTEKVLYYCERKWQTREVNGHKGYAVTEAAAPYLIWSDGEYLYYLSGNVSYDVLEKMADSIE